MNCPGCFNQATHSPEGGSYIEPEDLADQIVSLAEPGTEGITISGGEPMQQVIGVYRLLCMVKAIRPEFSIGMFTGYTLGELYLGRYTTNELVASDQTRSNIWSHQIRTALDWGCFGRYDKTKPPKPNEFVSSANQVLDIFRRYQYADFDPMKEVLIGEDGLTQITGVLS
jgi:organic radical activating enzyme